MSENINILLVEDQDLVRTAIQHLLTDAKEISIVGEAGNGAEAIKLVKKLEPHVVLLDLNLPDTDGLKITREIQQTHPDIKILILTVCNDGVFPSRLLNAGALGYLTKDNTTSEELIKAINYVAQGKKYISPNIAQSLVIRGLDSINDSDIFTKLSDRELEVAMLLAQGKKTPSIATMLSLSSKTINSYRYRIFEKLQVNGDVELALLAVRHGLVPIETKTSDEED